MIMTFLDIFLENYLKIASVVFFLKPKISFTKTTLAIFFQILKFNRT